MKEILDVIHNTIYQFFDVCGDDEEVPMSDKDKLLLEVNKAICNNLKALEQEPIDKSAMMYEIYMEGVNMTGEYQGCWVRFKDIEKIVNKYMAESKVEE